MENLINMDDLGGPLSTPIFGNTPHLRVGCCVDVFGFLEFPEFLAHRFWGFFFGGKDRFLPGMWILFEVFLFKESMGLVYLPIYLP